MMNSKALTTMKKFIAENNVLFVLIFLMIMSTFLSDVFLTWNNLTNIMRQYTPLVVVAIGMVIVVLTGGIDLAVGSTVAVASVTTALLITGQFSELGALGILLTIIVAALFGLILGACAAVLVAILEMPPFVASLAMMTISRGLAYVITNGEPIRLNFESDASNALIAFGSKMIPGILLPYPILIAIILTVVFWFVFKYTAYGRLIIAIGSNESAVALSGIQVKKYKFSVYVISGILCAIAGILITARAGVGVPKTGVGLELDALAACVIGGARMSGGKGKIVNTVIGVMVLALISNIMNLMSVPVYPQQIIKGLIIIAAVLSRGIKKK